MMGKLAIVFVALFMAAVAASSSNLLDNLKSLEQVKRTATLLKPLLEQKKSADNVGPLMMAFDANHDGSLDANELKGLLSMSGIPPAQMDMILNMLMGFDQNKDKKLNINELKAAGQVLGF